jgi:hypothetical protein
MLTDRLNEERLECGRAVTSQREREREKERDAHACNHRYLY